MTPLPEILPPCLCGNIACGIPYGTCHCGCNQKTTICPQSAKKHGYIKGRPRIWVDGHSSYRKQTPQKAVPFKIDGVYCRLIPLTQGMFAIVNEEDYWQLAYFKWQASRSKHGRCYYAVRHVTAHGPTLFMHREVLGLPPGDSREGDHIDVHNTLNNSRKNLRIATRSQQVMNQRLNSRNTSGFKGVSYAKNVRKFRSEIMVDGVSYLQGYFDTPEEAYEARCEATYALHGEFARLK